MNRKLGLFLSFIVTAALSLGLIAAPANAVDNQPMGTDAVWINNGPFGNGGPTGSDIPDPVGKQTVFSKPFKPAQYDTAIIDGWMAGPNQAGTSTWYRQDLCNPVEKTATGDWTALSAAHGDLVFSSDSRWQLTLHDLGYNAQVRVICKFRWRPHIGLAYPSRIEVAAFEHDYLNGVLVGTPIGADNQGHGFGINMLYTGL